MRSKPNYSLPVFDEILCEEDFSEVYNTELTVHEMDDLDRKRLNGHDEDDWN